MSVSLNILWVAFVGVILSGMTRAAEAAVALSFDAGAYVNSRSVAMNISWGSVKYTKMKLTNNNNCSGGSWTTISKTPQVTLADSDGLQYMSVQLKTKRGFTSSCTVASTTLDRELPTGSVLVGAVQTTPTVQVPLTLCYTDNIGINDMSVLESADCSSTTWVSSSSSYTLALSAGSGVKNIAVQFRDKALNLSSCYLTSITVEANPTPTPTPGVEEGKLHVDGRYLKNSLGEIVQLRGVSIPDPEHLNTKYWERPGVNAQSMAQDAIENFNVNVIRIPVLPGSSSYPNEGWFSATNGGQKYYDDHLAPLVEYITSQKVYAIIDLHYISDYSSLYSNVASFWTFIAPKFANNPYVIYEIFNEPIYPDSWSTWKSTIAQPIVNLIRTYATENVIIVGGPYWSSHMSGAATSPVSGSNIMYTAHVYSNQSSAAWQTNYGATMEKYPLFVTEWGFEADGTEGGTASSFGTPFLDWMEVNQLSWSAWCFDNLWGPRMFDENWNLTSGDGGMGTFVQEALLSN